MVAGVIEGEITRLGRGGRLVYVATFVPSVQVEQGYGTGDTRSCALRKVPGCVQVVPIRGRLGGACVCLQAMFRSLEDRIYVLAVSPVGGCAELQLAGRGQPDL